MDYRHSALNRLEQAEDLDEPVRFARSWGWAALAALAMAMGVMVLWAFLGTIPHTTTVPGILIHPDGGFPVQSTVAGQLVRLSDGLKEGAEVRAGQLVAEVTTPDRQVIRVDAPADGTVTEVLAHAGQVVTAGSTIVIADAAEGKALSAVLYAAPQDASAITVGQSVDLAVASAPQPEFGLLRGTVTDISPVPQGQAQIAALLGDDDLAARFTPGGRQAVKVTVRLTLAGDEEKGSGRGKDAQTSGSSSLPPHFVWSNGAAPPFPVASRTLVTGSVHLPDSRPVDWLGA
ncbi:HlyD family efflux transporter periplasmic adaptor subunit [Streptomyces sp. NPDC048290]|uniref:HlyD family efflux transporter periplasmic adaptor subunit n=1 Tax=Streptomyces sp. NPDC048290 TaxID=3155811 RepID=UPI0034451C55